MPRQARLDAAIARNEKEKIAGFSVSPPLDSLSFRAASSHFGKDWKPKPLLL
jgi:hypothetical protein